MSNLSKPAFFLRKILNNPFQENQSFGERLRFCMKRNKYEYPTEQPLRNEHALHVERNEMLNTKKPKCDFFSLQSGGQNCSIRIAIVEFGIFNGIPK